MGSGFQILPVGNKRLVQSVPGELSMDHAAALQLAQVGINFRPPRNYNPICLQYLTNVDFLQLSLPLFA